MLAPADFEPHIGTPFAVTAEGHEEVLTLVEVRLGKAGPGLTRLPFELLFTGSRADLMLHPHIRELRHPAFDSLELDIFPTGRRDDGTFEYVAAFN